MSHRVLTLGRRAQLAASHARAPQNRLGGLRSCAQLDPIWEALSVSIAGSSADRDVPPLVLTSRRCAPHSRCRLRRSRRLACWPAMRKTLLPYRGEWNSDALEWLAETPRAVKDQVAIAHADDVLRDAFAGRAAAASAGLGTAAPEGACPAGSRPSARALSFFHQRFQLQLAGGRIALRWSRRCAPRRASNWRDAADVRARARRERSPSKPSMRTSTPAARRTLGSPERT